MGSEAAGPTVDNSAFPEQKKKARPVLPASKNNKNSGKALSRKKPSSAILTFRSSYIIIDNGIGHRN
jgi:hypothetical protein